MIYTQGHVYIMSNKYRTTFYIGVTSDLRHRVWQHINGEGSLFVKRYRLNDLVYHEYFCTHRRCTSHPETTSEDWLL